MSEGHIARHRNYGLLMKRHHRDLRMRRLTIALIYLLIIIAIAVLFIVVRKEEQHRKMQQQTPPATASVSSSAGHLTTANTFEVRFISASDC
ncbi:hypothetical protein WBG78_06710 [Chryseolinea sp. T2]|uniref:hypothetical protein n=1 Tax=Chryseolinea sp. T2 TaxID=3129255 RepID=UPI003078447C